MKRRGAKITGSTILTLIGVLCFAAIVVSATGIIWASFQTGQSSAVTQVSFSSTNTAAWGSNFIPDGAHECDLTTTATYNYGGQASITYYLKVIATAGSGTIATGDFTVAVSGVTTTMTESSAGTWISGAITVLSAYASDGLTIKITPEAGSVDLSGVVFTVEATSA